MALTFRDCRECGESHALRPDGRMSIHTTVRGERCTEPEPAAPPRTRRESRPPRQRERGEIDPELQAAFDVSDARRRRKDDREPGRMDRRIYATGGVHTVRGGAPGSGKRR